MTWLIDVRTMLLLGAVLTAMFAGMLQLVSLRQPAESRASMRWWVLGALAYAVGFALTGFRDLIWIGWSAVLANLLLCSGFASFALALRRFFGVPARERQLLALVLGGVMVSAWFAFVRVDNELRHAGSSVFFAALLWLSARTVYRSGHRPSMAQHLTGSFLLIGTALMLVRLVALLVVGVKVPNIFQVTPLQVITYAFGALLPVVSTFGFLLMCHERSQSELREVARLDYLTGIYNRRAIEELAHRLLATARRQSSPLSVMIADLDHFKRINDELGHLPGDRALVAMVRVIRGQLRAGDLMGRLGGEEFVVVIPGDDLSKAVMAAERVRLAIAEAPMVLDGRPWPITVSIGVTALRPGDESFSDLLRRADDALYAAKHGGRNQVRSEGHRPRPVSVDSSGA